MIVTKIDAIMSLKPNAQFHWQDDKITWVDKKQTEPTESEIKTEIARLQAIEDYQAPRRAEYPSIGDQLDALYHAGTFDSTMTATIKAVKDKYPKP
jgi:hypothetical protein